MIIQAPGLDRGLVPDNAHGGSVHAGEPGDDIGGKGRQNFKKLIVVHDFGNDLVHVIGFFKFSRNNFGEDMVFAVQGVIARECGRGFFMVGGQKTQKIPDQFNALFIRFCHKMGLACDFTVNLGAAEFLQSHGFAGHILNDLGAGNDHLALFFNHDDKIRQGRGIDRYPGTGSHDGGNLGNDAGCGRVPVKHAGNPLGGKKAFMEPPAAGVKQSHNGGLNLQGFILDPVDFLAVDGAHGPAKNGNILGIGKDHAGVDGAVPDDHAVSSDFSFFHAKIHALAFGKVIQFNKAARVK